MRWLTIKTWEYRKQAKECWHKWFAWHPITIKKYPDGAKELIWLTYILRKGRWCDWGAGYQSFSYKLLKNNQQIHLMNN